MRLRTFIFLIFIGAICSVASLFLIIFNIDPGQAGFLGLVVFYCSLFLALSGVIFLIGDWLRLKFFKKQIIYFRLNNAIRQAILFGILIVGWALLQSRGLASILNIILLILLLMFLEFFFVSYQKKSQLRHERENLTT